MPRPLNFFYLLTLSTINPTAYAFWRTACSVIQTGRIDPILSPDSISGHVHKIAGGSEVNPYSTYDSLQTSTCSSCEIQADKSAYWTPQLYFAHSNGSYEEVPNEGMTVYYVGRGENVSSTVPFPPGFKMISGNSLKRSYDNNTLTYLNTRPVADRVSFRCIDANNDIPETHFMDQTNCVNGLRAQLNFQSCWDGVNLYLDNSEHVAYLSEIDNGVCPPDHPIQLPHLFFEVLYWTNYVDQSAGGEFVFANGDTTGYGFHGDFLNGWDMDVQTSAVENCLYTDDNGQISACPVLFASDDVNFSRDCLPQPEYWNEPVLGMLSQLPGCNPITSGPGDATQIICPINSSQPLSTSTMVVSSSPTTTFTGSYVSSTTFTDTQFTTIPSAFTTSSGAVFTTVPAATTTNSSSTSAGGATQSTGGIFVPISSANSSTASTSFGATTQSTGSIFMPVSSANNTIDSTSSIDPPRITACFANATAPATVTTFITVTAPPGTIQVTPAITRWNATATRFTTTTPGMRRALRRTFTA